MLIAGGIATLATRSKTPVTAAGPDATHEGEVPDSRRARTAGACLLMLWATVLVAAEVRAGTLRAQGAVHELNDQRNR